MTIQIDPLVLGIHLTTFLILAAGVASVIWHVRQSPSFGLPRRAAYVVSLNGALWALVGARALHIVDFAAYYLEVPLQVFYVWNGGLSAWGAVLVGGGGALWHARQAGGDVWRFADRLALAALVILAFGSMGDFLAGERIGERLGLFLAVTYAHPESVAFGLGPMHPVALYAVAYALVVGTYARWRMAGWPPGHAAKLALASYAAIRIVLGWVSVAPLHQGLDLAQWTGIAVLTWMAARWAKRRRARGRAPH